MSCSYLLTSLRILFVTGFFISVAIAGHAEDQSKQHKAASVGKAYGFVVDADTHRYLSGAQVALVLPSDIEPIKDSSKTTDENGCYEINAPLGTSSTHFATDRVMDLSIVSLLAGGGKKVEHHVDISELMLTVSKPGYKTFCGTVPVEYADAGQFQVRLCPIVLMPDAIPHVSYVDPHLHLGKIEIAPLPSLVLSPDEVINYSAKVSSVPLRPHTQISLWCRGSAGGYTEVKNGRPQSDMTFNGHLRIDKKAFKKPGLYTLTWDLRDNNDELLPCPVPAQIIAVGVPAADKTKIEALVASAPAGATQYYVDTTQPDKPLVNQMAALLPVDADLLAVVDFLNDAPMVDGIPSPYQRAKGQRIIDLQSQINDPYTSANEKQTLQKQLDALTPGNHAPLSSAQKQKVLDQQITILQANMNDPKYGTVTKMLLAQLYFNHGEYDQAWPLYEELFQDPNTKKKKDFYLFHNYATLLLGKGRHSEAIQYFAAALANAHTPSLDYSMHASQELAGGKFYTVYNGPELLNSSGYLYPEAVADQLIVENDMEQEPDPSNWLSETVLGRAMTEIGLIDQGEAILQKVVQVCPDQPEALFALAFAQDRAHDKSAALNTVNRGLALDPNDADAVELKSRL